MVKEKNTKSSQGIVDKVHVAHGVGRRKSSVARVWLKRGNGKVTVNGREARVYFDTDITHLKAVKPLTASSIGSQYDVMINVSGGGLWGQADAASLGFARALVSLDESQRVVLRKEGLLTSDSRVKERKKYGQRGARRKFQFVKR